MVKIIRKDLVPLPEAKGVPVIICEEKKVEENKITWFNIDWRNNNENSYIKHEIKKLLKK